MAFSIEVQQHKEDRMRTALLFSLICLGLTGCIDVHHERVPAETSTTVVTPQPQATYVAPPTSTTVVRTP